MKLAIMQPYLFPYIGYWQLINYSDIFVLYDDVNYFKGGFINRNYILFNGKKQRFTLNLRKASINKKINEISVLKNNHKKIIKTIEYAYSKAKYFNNVFPMLKEILSNNEENLVNYIEYSIQLISNYLNINCKIKKSSSIEKKNYLTGKEKIIDICKIINCKQYINLYGGIKLYRKTDFEKNGIQLKFLKPIAFKYLQFNHEFLGSLSIIDILMFNSQNTIKKYLQNFLIV